MPRVFLIRHGETDWNRQRRVLGWSETPLNDRGIAQAQALSGLLPPYKIGSLYSSPLPRTLQTAQILGEALGLTPIIHPHFTEANIGDWQGMLWKDLADDKVRLDYYERPTMARPPRGETFSEVRSRAVSGMEQLVRQDPEGSFLIVTHADLIRCVLSHFLGIDIRIVRKFWIEHTSLTGLTFDSDGATLHFLNLYSQPSL
jgi:phosphoserine phosphatase